MGLYRIDVKVCATAYIKAESEAEAAEKVRDFYMYCLDVKDTGLSDVPISGNSFRDLPDASLSPAMTLYGAWGDDQALKQDAPVILECLEDITEELEPEEETVDG